VKYLFFLAPHIMNLRELAFRSSYDQNSTTQMAFISCW